MKHPIIALACLVAANLCLDAAPWPPIKVPKITGTITAFSWVGEINFQHEEVWTIVNLTGLNKSVPLYFLRLGKTNLPRETRESITHYSKNTDFRPKILDSFLEDDEMIILIGSSRLKEVAVGIAIELTNYEIAADEFTSWAKQEKFLVDGRVPTKAKEKEEESAQGKTGNATKAEQAVDGKPPEAPQPPR